MLFWIISAVLQYAKIVISTLRTNVKSMHALDLPSIYLLYDYLWTFVDAIAVANYFSNVYAMFYSISAEFYSNSHDWMWNVGSHPS